MGPSCFKKNMKIKFKKHHGGFFSEDRQIFLCREGLEKFGLLKDFWGESFELEVFDERQEDMQSIILREYLDSEMGFYFEVVGSPFQLGEREYYAIRKLFPYKEILVLWVRVL